MNDEKYDTSNSDMMIETITEQSEVPAKSML